MPLDALGRPRTVLLLGARSDIGGAIVRRLVEGGATTVLAAGRQRPGLDPGIGAEAVEHLAFDAIETSDHGRFFDDVFARHPSIDMVIVAFGVLHSQEDAESEPGRAVEMAQVNYVGAASALLHLAAHLRRQGSGRVVVLSSVAGLVPRRSNYIYGSSKAGLDFLARGLADSLDDTAVDVMIVRPGFVRTAMTEGLKPVMFAVSPEAVADAVVDGAARRRRVVWVPPILRLVMVAVRMLPPALVRRLGG